MKFLNFSLLLILSSCGGGVLKQSSDNLSYRSSGIEQFFLPELPKWANFAQAGQCQKQSSIHYLDYARVKEVYQLDYSQLVELQAQYNFRLEEYFRSATARFLKPAEQVSMFANTLEQVRGGVRLLQLPASVREVDLIWLESLSVEELKKMASQGKFDERLPILFSDCHTRQSLQQWLIENKLDEVGFYTMTSEWLAPFSGEVAFHPFLAIEPQAYLGKDVKVNLIMSPTAKSTEIIIR